MSDSHSFTLVLSGIEELTAELEDALFEANCDDALLGIRNGVPYLDFTREADSFIEAVQSAIRDADQAGVGVLRVEPDDLVTMAEIARRLGRSRESVRLLWAGNRGPGGFPAPVSNLRGRSPIWSWAEVLQWAVEHEITEQFDLRDVVDALFVSLANVCLADGDLSGALDPSLAEFEA